MPSEPINNHKKNEKSKERKRATIAAVYHKHNDVLNGYDNGIWPNVVTATVPFPWNPQGTKLPKNAKATENE